MANWELEPFVFYAMKKVVLVVGVRERFNQRPMPGVEVKVGARSVYELCRCFVHIAATHQGGWVINCDGGCRAVRFRRTVRGASLCPQKRSPLGAHRLMHPSLRPASLNPLILLSSD